MKSIRSTRLTALVSSLIAIASIAPISEAQNGPGHAEISQWIGRNHPNVIAGDPRVNAVLIVVDSASRYVASVADSLSPPVIAAIDSIFASVGAHNVIESMAHELLAGRLRVPNGDGSQPIYVVDGVRVGRVDSLMENAVKSIQFMNGAEAASKYGADAAKGGAVLVTMIHDEGWSQLVQASHRERLRKVGIEPERIDFGNTQMMQVRAGTFGPYRMNVTILRLK